MSAADPALQHRRRVIVACVAVLVVALAAVLVTVLVVGNDSDDPSSKPGSPAAAAHAWGTAFLAHDKSALARLSCPTGSTGVFSIVLSGSGVRTGAVTPRGSSAWDVALTSTGPGGGTTVHVRVEKRSGDYLVC